MPRLSEPMREALRMAAKYAWLWRLPDGKWSHVGAVFVPRMFSDLGGPAWTALDTTVRALDDRGFLRRDGRHYVITPAGREAIGRKDATDR